MKTYFIVRVSFVNSYPDKDFCVFCRSPQEAIESVCSVFYDKGYYFQRDYFIEFCAVKCRYEWTVPKKFGYYYPPEIDGID